MIRADIDGLVCDLDGVIYRGDEPVPGAARAIDSLRDAGVKVVFCTNNSRSTVEEYIGKLERVGVPASADEIVTSAVVTAEVLRARNATGRTAIVVGGQGIRQAIAGICTSVKDGVDSADYVIVGWTPEFTYDDMRRASTAVRKGAHFIATNDDATFPAARGLWPGAGAILASIETASGARAKVMGKPHAPMMDAVARRLEGCTRIGIVGDRPDTDLAGGIARGWTRILVLSGVTRPEDVVAISPPADLVLGSIAELIAD